MATSNSNLAAKEVPTLHLMRYQFDNFFKLLKHKLLTAGDTDEAATAKPFIIGISACNRREGASTIALNMATAYASNSSQKVLLVDGNLRDPFLHEYFETKREKGLSDLILGSAEIDDVVKEVTPKNLFFIPAGTAVAKPIILYGSEGYKALLNNLGKKFDLIIFDTAPLARYPETPIQASVLYGLIIVVEAEGTKWQVATLVKNNLEELNVRILGAILNKKRFYIPQFLYKFI